MSHTETNWQALADRARNLGFSETAEDLRESYAGDYSAAEEWVALKESEQAEADELEAQRDAEREAEEERQNRLMDNQAALERAVREAVRQPVYFRGGASGYAMYRGVKIRVSDHPAPEGGGWRVNSRGEEGRLGSADVDLRYTGAADYTPPSRSAIRATIADALRQER